MLRFLEKIEGEVLEYSSKDKIEGEVLEYSSKDVNENEEVCL